MDFRLKETVADNHDQTQKTQPASSQDAAYAYDQSDGLWTVRLRGGMRLATDLTKAEARLLAAAYTSYDKHCGPKAVQMAEEDLLGQLIEAVSVFIEADEEYLSVDAPGGDKLDNLGFAKDSLRSILDKLTP